MKEPLCFMHVGSNQSGCGEVAKKGIMRLKMQENTQTEKLPKERLLNRKISTTDGAGSIILCAVD